MARDSIIARPISMIVMILPLAPGLRATPSTAFEIAIPWPIPVPKEPSPMPIPAAITHQAKNSIFQLLFFLLFVFLYDIGRKNPLVGFLVSFFQRTGNVDHGQQHEDERLNE